MLFLSWVLFVSRHGCDCGLLWPQLTHRVRTTRACRTRGHDQHDVPSYQPGGCRPVVCGTEWRRAGRLPRNLHQGSTTGVQIQQRIRSVILCMQLWHHIDGLMQKRPNFSALAMELRLSCINPSISCCLWGNLKDKCPSWCLAPGLESPAVSMLSVWHVHV